MNSENTDLEAPAPDREPESAKVPDPSTTKTSEPLENKVKQPAEPARRSGGLMAFLAMIFALAAIGLSGWMWWQGQAESGQIEARVFQEISRLESSDSELSLKLKQVREEVSLLTEGDVSDEFARLQERLQSDRAALAEMEQTLQQQQSMSRSLQAAATSMQGRLQAAEAAVSNLSARELDSGGELDLAEVDYLLRLANERVKLFADPVAADQALEVADQHLAALDNPMYIGVRQDIAEVRGELAALDLPDYLEIAGRLDQLQAVIPTLAFEGDELAAPQAVVPAEHGWWEKTKSVFASLVTVRRSTEQENERLSLEDRDYVRQRIWLQLEVAHLALMRRDQESFRGALQRTRDTMADWFVQDDREFTAVDAEIEALQSLEIEVQVPDITKPWNALRVLRAPVPAAVPLPEAQVDPAMGEGPVGDEARAEETDG